MHIVLASGVYTPDLGGPATYAEHLAAALVASGHTVTVLAYAPASMRVRKWQESQEPWRVVRVSRAGGSLLRWWRYAAALRRYAASADVVYGLSAVSVGIPMRLSRMKGPVRVLRLGGDFLWERYTDMGGQADLRSFYTGRHVGRRLLVRTLQAFEHLVFSTSYQQIIYQQAYRRRLPPSSVIENAVNPGTPTKHVKHEPLKVVFLGRFVRFKNLGALFAAVADLPYVQLTIVGEGPLSEQLSALARRPALKGRVTFRPAVRGAEKQALFQEQDVLVLPSLTEISPHSAIEARAAGLPVLLHEEHGLSEALANGMMITRLSNAADITRSLIEVDRNYDTVAAAAAAPYRDRPWELVAAEHIALFESLRAAKMKR